ncbi:unnamed protein product [Plutella xylostella]|uniref:(diamondback moth) hypothetical protein n=1 Tax=Plutella xylostella TaxID=51655 RepID=A0A8S4EY45_PLUXY|nr:unnamed protein product [Plutella xylostella]
MLNHPLYITSDHESLIPSHCNFGKYMLDTLRKYSDEIALINSNTGKSLTYKELTQYAVDLSHGLYKLGVKRGEVVGLGSEIRNDFIPTMLAVLMTGATFISLDYRGGQDPTLQKLKLIKPKYFISTELYWDKYGEALKSLDFIETWITLDDAPDSAIPVSRLMATSVDVQLFEPAVVDGQSDVAIAYYTSGTTGTSKIVLKNHVNLFLMADKDGLMYENVKVIYSECEWYHTYDCFFTMTFMLGGKTIVYHPNATQETILHDILHYKINCIATIPSTVVLMSQLENVTFDSLQAVHCSCSHLPNKVIDIFNTKYPNVKLYQAYGMTEGSPLASEKPEPGKNKKGSLGKPVCNTTIKIIDPVSRQVLGPNQPGEMWFRGPVLMKGYLNVTAPILDAEGFFNTGDIGYYDDDHFIFFKNRAKDCIVYDGFEVGVVDLEHMLLSHVGVQEACVVGKPDPVFGDLPTAFVVTAPGADVTEDQLVTYINSQVEHYMYLRGGVKFVDEIPKNKRGKILRRKLVELLTKQ